MHGCLNVTSGWARLEYGSMLENLKVVVHGSCDERELVNVVDVKMDMHAAPVELAAVESQLKFRKFVLKQKNMHGCLNGGVVQSGLNYGRKLENLKVVVRVMSVSGKYCGCEH